MPLIKTLHVLNRKSPNTVLVAQALLEVMSACHNEALHLVDIRTI